MKKLLNKANPSKENFNEFSILMKECESLFKNQVEGYADVEELVELIKELVYNQESDGYWRLISSDDMPFDAKVEYWKYPTILFTSIMMHFQLNYPRVAALLKGFDETLVRALNIVERGKLTGHGFDSFNFKVDALKTLLKAEVMKFIKLYPEKHNAFTDMIYFNKVEIEKLLKEGNTIFDFNQEFRLRLEELYNMMSSKKKAYLFVYGTLMRSNRKGLSYLDDAEFKGEATLKSYALYDLGYYPGIVEDEDGRVKGELYSIFEDKLPQIDVYEAEGSLYKRKIVKVCSEKQEVVEAYVYVYNQSVEGRTRIRFEHQPWFQGIEDLYRNYVWYACYGSNLSKERFMKYINGDKTSSGIRRDGCSDKTPPSDEKPITLKYPIYFANHSSKWDGKGVAFLDISKKGRSYGKMYLITKEQFEEIHLQEGNVPNWYNEIVDLGLDGGIPIKTITHSPRHLEEVMPSKAYLEVIKKGIQETYPTLDDLDIEAYLMKKYLNEDRITVLRYLRNQEHGVAIQRIVDDLGREMKNIINIIHDLKDAELIKQDGRSVRAGLAWNEAEAIYYTISDKRRVIDKVIK